MFKSYLRVPVLLGAACLLAPFAQAQIASVQSGRNNPYSPSPDGRTRTLEIAASNPAPRAEITIAPAATAARRPERPRVVESSVPTEIYKVGIGDVLLVEVKNVSQGHGYYTVRESGTIDFPLAGGSLIVADKTPLAIASEIADRITLFADPQVEVTVREYGSHKVTISGLVDHPGEKSLQREAIPLFVIMAEAGLKPTAGRAVITRAPLLKPETYSLADKSADSVLIYPGNSVEFVEAPAPRGIVFIAGSVMSPGQKELMAGQTLYQAVAAAGGATGRAKKGVIRRKDDKGVLAVIEFNLRSIRDGKVADPVLKTGDIVEITD